MNELPFDVVDVKKTFRSGDRSVTALRGVSLSVQEGEFLAIMGASGSGKSTLLHAIAGLTEIDEGTICVEGQKLTGLSDAQLTRFRRERVGLVFQAFNLIPTLTARDNIRLPVLSDPMRSANADRLLRELGLADRGGHRPDELSGGEQQRVAIARALICDPAIVLLDEPTGSLDSVAGRELCVLLRRLSDQSRRTVVVVTHEPAVACWAGRVVVLKDGQVVDSFPTDAYQNAETLAQRYQAALEAQADCQA